MEVRDGGTVALLMVRVQCSASRMTDVVTRNLAHTVDGVPHF